MVGQFIQKKEEEKQIEEDQAANARYWKILACCDDEEDYNFAIIPNEPLIQKKQEEKRIEEEQAAKAQNSKIPVCYDDDDDYNSAITPNEPTDQHHFNAESDLIESMLNHDYSIISSSSKIDSLLDEFAGEHTLLKLISLGIDGTDCHPEEDIRLIERLLYDNSSPRPLEEFVFENSNAEIESFSPSHIPVEDRKNENEKSEKGLIAEFFDWDEESVSLEDEGTTKIKTFMAIAEDEPSVRKADARSGQWVDITMKKDYIKRSDNGTEFRNHKLEEFCDEKRISYNFSSSCTPEQIGVAERRNKTLIEAAKTMLNNSISPEEPPEFTNADDHPAFSEHDHFESGDNLKPAEIQDNVIIKPISDTQSSPTTIAPSAESILQTHVPQNRWSREKHIKLVNIIGEPFAALEVEGWIIAMQEELNQFERNKGYNQQEGIDYKETFAPVERLEAIRIFFAFAAYIGFMVYRMDMKSAFLNGKISKETPLASKVTLTSHMLKVAKLFQDPKQYLILSFEKVNANDGANKSSSGTIMQPVTQPKAPTDLKLNKKKIPPSFKLKSSHKARVILPKNQVADTQLAEETVATTDATKILDTSKLVEEQVNQPKTIEAKKNVLNDEPLVKKLKFLIPTSSLILSPTPLKSILPKPIQKPEVTKMTLDQFTKHLIKTTSYIFSSAIPRELTSLRDPTPFRDESKGKGIATKEPLKGIMPYMEKAGLVSKIPCLKSFVIPEGKLTNKDIMAQVKEMKRLADLKAEKEKSEKSLQKTINPATIMAQAQKMVEYEDKRKKY
uniref:Integrase catalytic domain-containing protein n=1 Tax=Tanacetum cinerariifolium TaxID=118510 RepID=A0A6L2JKW4_TANCI|nr:hypothetical protein [Tanacetum cinerariifolium]